MTHKPFSLFFKLMLAVLVCVTVLGGQTLRAESTPSVQKPAPAAQKLMVFGDSLVAGYGLPAGDAFPAQLEQRLRSEGYDITVINAGVSGDTTSAGLTRLEWSLSQNPSHIIVVLGGNDMLRQVARSVTRDNLGKILTTLAARDIPVLLAGMQAYGNLEEQDGDMAAIYRDAATKHGALLYPFFLEGVAMDATLNLNDGIHPNTQGVAKIVDNILPDVKKLLAQ